jgi:hypothetical protein
LWKSKAFPAYEFVFGSEARVLRSRVGLGLVRLPWRRFKLSAFDMSHRLGLSWFISRVVHLRFLGRGLVPRFSCEALPLKFFEVSFFKT